MFTFRRISGFQSRNQVFNIDCKFSFETQERCFNLFAFAALAGTMFVANTTSSEENSNIKSGPIGTSKIGNAEKAR